MFFTLKPFSKYIDKLWKKIFLKSVKLWKNSVSLCPLSVDVNNFQIPPGSPGNNWRITTKFKITSLIFKIRKITSIYFLFGFQFCLEWANVHFLPLFSESGVKWRFWILTEIYIGLSSLSLSRVISTLHT